jgi:hypothetical protein
MDLQYLANQQIRWRSKQILNGSETRKFTDTTRSISCVHGLAGGCCCKIQSPCPAVSRFGLNCQDATAKPTIVASFYDKSINYSW